ncbi:hypothetical protein C8R48DRAFT_667610 [Suillus tomentosus]|nr:hypothetical protein C8R48DRAFT_678710 [Suillus tomentosus]KAG1881871.1 hypothetical protein C8R48DRAFT_667610 [Suillus tomentosus]
MEHVLPEPSNGADAEARKYGDITGGLEETQFNTTSNLAGSRSPIIAPQTAPTHVRNCNTRTQRYMRRAQATTFIVASSILTNVEIEIDPSISYPTLEVFLAKLDNEEPARRWSEIFLPPLRWMGVRTIDDMCIVSPESVSGFFNLSPIMVMDLFVHVVDAVFVLQARKLLTQELEPESPVEAPLSSTDRWVVNLAEEKIWPAHIMVGVGESPLEAPLSSTDRWVVNLAEEKIWPAHIVVRELRIDVKESLRASAGNLKFKLKVRSRRPGLSCQATPANKA